MNNTQETHSLTYRSSRKKKAVVDDNNEESMVYKKVGIPLMLEPTEHDIRDELCFFDSYNYSRYNE